jgi:hypothetical protein
MRTLGHAASRGRGGGARLQPGGRVCGFGRRAECADITAGTRADWSYAHTGQRRLEGGAGARLRPRGRVCGYNRWCAGRTVICAHSSGTASRGSPTDPRQKHQQRGGRSRAAPAIGSGLAAGVALALQRHRRDARPMKSALNGGLRTPAAREPRSSVSEATSGRGTRFPACPTDVLVPQERCGEPALGATGIAGPGLEARLTPASRPPTGERRDPSGSQRAPSRSARRCARQPARTA